MSAYRTAVLADSPAYYWRLGQVSYAGSGSPTFPVEAGGTSPVSSGPWTFGVPSLISSDPIDPAVFANASSPAPVISGGNVSMASGERSMEFWIKPGAGSILTNHIGGVLGTFWFDMRGDGGCNTGVSAGSSYPTADIVPANDNYLRSTGGLFAAGTTYYVVVTATHDVGPNKYTIRLYINAVLIDSFQFINPSNAPGIQAAWSVGETGAAFNATVDEMAVYTYPLTPVQISAHWTAAGGAGGDTTAPVIQNVIPTNGSNITTGQVVQFDVNDADSGIKTLILVASYADRAVKELIHDGTAFNAGYTGSANTRTPIVVSSVTTGYTFTVLRDGGWPATPTFTVYAVDPSGNTAGG